MAQVIKYITVHCSASGPKANLTAKDIDKMHRAKGWLGIGYHYVIRKDGTVEKGRPDDQVGSHVAGHNTGNLGVCYVGGLDSSGKSADTRTPEQIASMIKLLKELKAKYPTVVEIKGHRDWSPDLNKDGKISSNEWMKDCPCFDVSTFIKQNGI